MGVSMGVNQEVGGPVFGYPYQQCHPYTDMEKRQLFLRSYQFSRRKKTVGERIRGSFFRVKRVIWVRLRSARKIRWLLWFRLRSSCGLCFSSRKTRFLRLHNHNNSNLTITRSSSSSSSCFW